MNIHTVQAIRDIVRNWRANTRIAYWGNPSGDDWKYPRYDIPIVINDDGEEVEENIQRKIWWDRLVKESDENLKKEDAAASIIQAALHGRQTRLCITDIIQTQIEIERYHYDECHGGC